MKQIQMKPSLHSKLVIALIAVVFFACAMLGYFLFRPEVKQPAANTVDSYDSCVAAGNPVQQSFPERCSTTDGKTFTNSAQQ